MATERLSPAAILVQTGLSGDVSVIQDDPDSPDANWLTNTSTNANNELRNNFPTPTGSPDVGAGLQQFKAWIRKNASAGNNVTWSLELWENGSQVGAALSTGTVTSTTGALISGTFNASSLTTADGSQVECRIVQTGGGSGGSAGARRWLEIGAVEWNVTYTAATPKSASDTATVLGTETTVPEAALTVTDTAAILGTETAGADSGEPSPQPGVRSLLAFWLGGGSVPPVTATPISASDTATVLGTEAITVAAAVDQSDTATVLGTETLSIAAAASATDTATVLGTESIDVSVGVVPVSVPDTATILGTESIDIEATASADVFDTATVLGSETVTIAAAVSRTDTATVLGSEAPTIAAAVSIQATATVLGTESVSSLADVFPVAVQTTATVLGTESITATLESAAPVIPVTATVRGSEVVQVAATVSIANTATAQGVEQVPITVPIAVTDLATIFGIETPVVIISPIPLMALPGLEYRPNGTRLHYRPKGTRLHYKPKGDNG